MPPTGDPARGRLLVATPPLVDPNFDRTVVFLIEHRDDGSIGVVLNRPTTEPVGPPLDRWADLLGRHAVLFDGGPVEPHGVIALASTNGAPDSDGPLTPITASITASISSVDLSADPTTVPPLTGAVRIFRGYAGWGPGQLAAELRAGAWITVDAHPGDVVDDRPSDLWRSVLGRQSGRLAWLAGAPDDLELN